MKQIAKGFGYVAVFGICITGLDWCWETLLLHIKDTPLSITSYPNLNGCFVLAGLLLIAIPILVIVFKVIQFGNKTRLWEFIGTAIDVMTAFILIGASTYCFVRWLFSK
jgi:hypothetical protein